MLAAIIAFGVVIPLLILWTILSVAFNAKRRNRENEERQAEALQRKAEYEVALEREKERLQDQP